MVSLRSFCLRIEEQEARLAKEIARSWSPEDSPRTPGCCTERMTFNFVSSSVRGDASRRSIATELTRGRCTMNIGSTLTMTTYDHFRGLSPQLCLDKINESWLPSNATQLITGSVLSIIDIDSDKTWGSHLEKSQSGRKKIGKHEHLCLTKKLARFLSEVLQHPRLNKETHFS